MNISKCFLAFFGACDFWISAEISGNCATKISEVFEKYCQEVSLSGKFLKFLCQENIEKYPNILANIKNHAGKREHAVKKRETCENAKKNKNVTNKLKCYGKIIHQTGFGIQRGFRKTYAVSTAWQAKVMRKHATNPQPKGLLWALGGRQRHLVDFARAVL